MECVHFACPGKHLERHHAEARHGFFVDSLYGQVGTYIATLKSLFKKSILP